MPLQVSDPSVSPRAEAVARAISHLLSGFLQEIDYFTRREQPGMLDFTFGDPREMPPEAYVSALRTALTPQHEGWFAYKQYEPAAQEAAAASLGQLTGLPFEPDDILLTTGGFAALSVGVKAVADPGDEVIFSLPPWFAYEALIVEAGLVPVKVRIDLETLDLDIDAIAAAITPRTRIVIVNSPNNPTGRVYSAGDARAPGRRVGGGVGAPRAAHLPPLRRALQPDRLPRCAVSHPGRVLPPHPGGLQLRQDAPRAGAAHRLPGAAARAAGPTGAAPRRA